VIGEKASERFKLTYAGSPSQFVGKAILPEGVNEIKLQVLAADQAGNMGQHILAFRISP
jgi:hypothetical protein